MNVVTLQEAAKLTGIKESTLRDAINHDRLTARKSSGVWLIDLDDAEVMNYTTQFKQKVRLSEDEKNLCLVCIKSVPRKRAKYCSRECYAKTFNSVV